MSETGGHPPTRALIHLDPESRSPLPAGLGAAPGGGIQTRMDFLPTICDNTDQEESKRP